jgi:hypothetical protein
VYRGIRDVLQENSMNVLLGHFDQPQCVDVCPVDCIPVNPDCVETNGELRTKYEGLIAATKTAAGAGCPG